MRRSASRLAVLVLLLSGLLQSLAAAQGSRCARTSSPAPAPGAGAPSVGAAQALAAQHPLHLEGEHSSVPSTEEAGTVTAPCVLAAILPAEGRDPAPASRARRLLAPGDLPPPSFLIQSLFRPPRLS